MFSGRVPDDTAPNPWTERLEARRAAGAVLFDLNGQNPTRTGLAALSDVAREALAAGAAAPYEPDPLGLPAAREAIARYYASRGIAVEPGDIVLTSGTSESYAHLFRATCDAGDRALVPAPGYPLIGPLAALESVEAAAYPLRFEARWRLDRDALAREHDPSVKALIVIQPNHPTGSCLDDDEARFVARHCAERSRLLVSDEVFGDFMYGIDPPAARPSMLAHTEGPVAALHGLSKLCGMPQLKLGWIVLAGPAPERRRMREALAWIADAFLSVAAPVQHALPVLLEARHEFRHRTMERIRAHRAALAAALDATGATVLPADGGWVAMVRLPAGTGAEALALALLDRDVVVHPGHFYDVPGDRHLVVSLIPEPGVFAEGAARLAEVLGIG